MSKTKGMANIVDATGNDPVFWLYRADGLIVAAKVLRNHQEQRMEILWGELLLYGYALENLLKCLYLKRGNLLYRDGRFQGPKHHDLVRLVDTVGLSIDKATRQMLRQLTEVILWGGRYPVQAEGTDLISVYWDEERDYRLLDFLIESLRTELAAASS